MFLCQCIYTCAALLANFLCQCLFFTVQFHPEFYPNMFCWPPFSPCLNCLFLFCHASFDCRLALIVSNFLGALRQTHQHLKGKYIIPHYYSSAFFFILPSLRAADTATLLPKPGKDGVSSAYVVLILSLSNLAFGPLINGTASQLHQYSNLVISPALTASHSSWCLVSKATLEHYVWELYPSMV